jgi:RNA polymerase sigma factor (sigma-70 family)
MMVTSYSDAHDMSAIFDEVKLIFASQKGNLDAFNQLVLHYQGMIYNLAVRILGDSDAADDITQETFLTAYLNLPRFRNGSFRSWLYRIATNACYDVLRLHKRHPVLSVEKEIIEEQKFLPLFNTHGYNAIPEVEYERHELAHIIQDALSQLELGQRMVVVLVDLQDFDYQETAKILGIPVGTVKSRLTRGRIKLRQLLSTYWLFPEAAPAVKPINSSVMS